MIAPRFLRDPQRFNSIEASIAESSDLKVCWVFMGSKALDDQAALELDHLGSVLEPFKRGLVLGIDPVLEPVVFRSLKRGRVFCPIAANPNGVEFNFNIRPLFDVLEMVKKCAAGADAELRFPATSAEGIDELMLCNGLFHGLDRALIARQIPPVARWDRTGNQRLMKWGSDIKADGH